MKLCEKRCHHDLTPSALNLLPFLISHLIKKYYLQGMGFPEEFLHYVWRFKSFDFSNLRCTDETPLSILNVGLLNQHSGPDFSQGKIQIADTIWVGNIEIHLKSSDWLRHNHQIDPAYDNVILHVVFEHDAEIERKDGTLLPVLELKGRIAPSLIERYADLCLNLNSFPCSAQIGSIDKFIVDAFLSRTVIERFEQKAELLSKSLAQLNGNWDEAFYHSLAGNFGFKVNALPFELFAKSLPQQIYAKHKENPLQIEALVFGTAGFLNDIFTEEYPQKLKREFEFLKKKYNLAPLQPGIWKFMRMRPQNFPTIRLAQFAALILKTNHLFSKILNIKDPTALRTLFEGLPVNPYWKTHYHFKKEAVAVSTQIGRSSIDNVLLNTVALFLFAYGKYTDTGAYVHRAIKLLEQLPAENNAITTSFINAGVQLEHAFASQGAIQLKKTYCEEKKCLLCGIGIKILKQT
ncbi:hypothetical protein ABIB40_002012 [Pedobacter sp. UYP30]|uniref:DUF2851 family protein n=1 Tax=Pedobacter sp. UYP30 TaxID=1756400 RepID=UPI00339B8455